MMNKRIRSMIDEIFSEMRMSAENLALRDELMANAQARFEDAVASGRGEEDALAEVVASLEDVQALLAQMRAQETGAEAAETETAETAETGNIAEEKTEPDIKEEKKPEEEKKDDLSDALNKAFGALGEWGDSLMPQARQFAKDVDRATGGLLGGIGRAVNKGMRDAQKSASETIDRLTREAAQRGAEEVEITTELPLNDIDRCERMEKSARLREEAADLYAQAGLKEVTGDWENGKAMRETAMKLEMEAEKLEASLMQEDEEEAAEGGEPQAEKTDDLKIEVVIDLNDAKDDAKDDEERCERMAKAARLREEAADLYAQAGLKQVTGDAENAEAMRVKAAAMDAEADALEALVTGRTCVREDAPQSEETAQEPCPETPEIAEPLLDAFGEVNTDALDRAVEQAEQAARETEEAEHEEETTEADDEFARMTRDAAKALEDISGAIGRAAQETAQAIGDALGRSEEAGASSCGERRYPAPGLRAVDIHVGADDVSVGVTAGAELIVRWKDLSGEPTIDLNGHTLSIRHEMPDIFKTFFTVFKKDGGGVEVLVPRGYASDYTIRTTSGSVRLSGIDVDDVCVNTVSGSVRVEPLASVRAKDIDVNTISGAMTVSACAAFVKTNSISGESFVSCDAHQATLSTISGNLHAEGACENWEASSVSGSVELICTVTPTQGIAVETKSGDARVALPEDIRGFVAQMDGLSGSRVNEFGPNRYGTCALPIRMNSISGDLMITRL